MEKWTKEQENLLIEKYIDTDYKTLSNILNKTEGAIRAKCFDLKLVKNSRWTDDEIIFLLFATNFCDSFAISIIPHPHSHPQLQNR